VFSQILETESQVTAKTTPDIVPVKNTRTASHDMETFLDNMIQRKLPDPDRPVN